MADSAAASRKPKMAEETLEAVPLSAVVADDPDNKMAEESTTVEISFISFEGER
jgi:hypothetical protein